MDRPVIPDRAARSAERPPQVSNARPDDKTDRRKVAAAALGLLAIATVVALAALGGGDGSSRGGQEATQAAARDRNGAAEAQGRGEPRSPVSSEVDPARGAELNEEGFAMVEAGESEQAVPILEEAVSSFPEETEDLNYAYALFNLGHALRLNGRAEEAIPILERRLKIPDQEEAVRRELEAARAEAG
jgi:tetratricopeptide (TPR) repeat protein